MAVLAANDPILNSITHAIVDLTKKKFEWPGDTRELTMIYDQNTEYEYEMSDSSINVGTVVKYPYEDQYKWFLMKYLKSKDDLFETLTSVINVDRHERERSV